MYRDTLIKLILREIFKDPYLVNNIYNLVLNEEIYISSILHKIKTNNLREDIQILYPGFIKTSIFENIRFNEEDDIEPGFSTYIIKPLIPCGYIMNYNGKIPIRFPICEYTNYKKDFNGVKLINDIRKENNKQWKNRIKIILRKQRIFAVNDLKDDYKSHLWYDFENKLFTKI